MVLRDISKSPDCLRCPSTGPDCSGQLEDQLERVLDSAQLSVCELPNTLSEHARVNGSYHLAEYLRRPIEE